MGINLTEIISAMAMLDNALCRASGAEDGIITITVDPHVFKAIAAERPRAVVRNRLDLAGVIIRKDHGLTDKTQPEIKKRAG